MIATAVAGHHGIDLRPHGVPYGIQHNNAAQTHADAMSGEVMDGAIQLIRELDVPKFE